MKIEYINTPDMGKARRRTSDIDTIDYSYVPSEVLKDKFFGKKVYVRTYGCQANIRDEETMLGLLSTVGVTKTEEKGEADIAILNTCAVRENAEDKVYAEIGEFKHYKQKNKNLILILCGCMVEQKHIVDDVLVKFPHVDIFFGTHDVQDLLKLLDMYINKKRRYIDVSSKEGSIIENLPVKRLDNAKAFDNGRIFHNDWIIRGLL